MTELARIDNLGSIARLSTRARHTGDQATLLQRQRAAHACRNHLEGLLKKHKGNVTHCSEEAGMARSAFQKLMQKYGIRSSDFRE